MGRHRFDPPTAPPEPKYSHSEHEIHEPCGYDIDGFGVSEVDKIDGEPLTVVQEAYTCSREFCDHSPSVRYLYGTTAVSPRLRAACEYAAGDDGVWYEYAGTHCEVVDYDDGPILGVRFGEDVFGYICPSVTLDSELRRGGTCHGRSEPDWDSMKGGADHV